MPESGHNMISLPLQDCKLKVTETIFNRLHIFIHGAAILALLYYRIMGLIRLLRSGEGVVLPYLLVFVAEFILAFLWLLHQPSRWRPVKRVVFPERLPPDERLPAVDIFICTADPGKEPSIGVMNTVISAMALDYPPEKLAVYLSDDGGAPVTLAAMRESWKFAKVWTPFCRKYEVKTRCPEAYFSGVESSAQGLLESNGFAAQRKEIKRAYTEFKKKLEENSETIGNSGSKDHPPIVEVINDDDFASQKGMPLLVYMAREKRPSQPHHFKAGAINSLLRVSAIISNAPYFSVLDCDHYCNDPTSTRQAMCFYFDPKTSKKLAFVQFPQRFHNIGKHDLYDGGIRYYLREWDGLDGLQGPGIAGCNFYMRREASYGVEGVPNDLSQLKKLFGSSIELIKSTFESYEPKVSREDGKVSDAVKEEIHLLASCTYETGTDWGTEIGVPYGSLVEDAMKSLFLHSKGWRSVLIDPPRACYLGTCPTNLNDTLVQQTRWAHGLLTIALSKYSPLLYGPSRMSISLSMIYGAMTMDSLYFVSFAILGVVPQICLLHGVSLYPDVSSPFFYVFAFAFASSQLKHIQEVVSYGDPLATAVYELRMWMMKSVSCYPYAIVNAISNLFGLKEANFSLTNKVMDEEQVTRYQEGIYDFQSSPQLLAPMCSLYIINFAAFVVGTTQMFQTGRWNELGAQAVIPLFGILANHHLFDGMFLRADKGRVSPYITGLSAVISAVVVVAGSFALLHVL